MILDLAKPEHAAAEARLSAELIIWLTTVSPAGQPQSSPVWFLWQDGEFLIYGSKTGPKTANIKANPHVSLNLDGNGLGGGVVVFEGTARIDDSGAAAAPADVPAYLAKYQERIESYGWNLEQMAADYPHVIRVTPTRARIW
jgi:PPOX class probable F420-dependent enzyme